MPVNPVKRIRDGKRYFKPQQTIPYEEWVVIEESARQAKLFLKVDNFVYQMMKSDLAMAENTILENRIQEVKEVHIITDTLQKIFTRSEKVQVDELVGQLKYIRNFLAEMQSRVDFKAELERKEANGEINIQRNEKSDVQ